MAISRENSFEDEDIGGISIIKMALLRFKRRI